MKIKALRLKNFAKFEDFEIVFNNGVTKLIGINGSGKTTVGLTAIWAGFKGIAEKSKTGQLIGERFRFISDGAKSADVEILLHDERTGKDVKLKRHITKTVNQISIEAIGSDNQPTKEYIENLFNITFLSASHFTSLSGKEQALALGINVSTYDEELANEKADAAMIRKELKNIGELSTVQKVEKVSVFELLAQRDEQVKLNNNQEKLVERRLYVGNTICEHEETIERLKGLIAGLTIELNNIPIPGIPFDLSLIDNDIKGAEDINIQADQYERYCVSRDNKSVKEKDLEESISSQGEIKNKRLEYIKSNSFGIDGISIDDEGSLLMDNKPFRPPYFSKGEFEMIVARISSNLNPELKVRFIDDFEMLDDQNQELIISKLTEKGYQIITAEVGDKAEGDNSVLLRECKVVENNYNGGVSDQFDHLDT